MERCQLDADGFGGGGRGEVGEWEVYVIKIHVDKYFQ